MFQIQVRPKGVAVTGSARLCSAITAMLRTARGRTGSRARKPRATIDQPRAQRIESRTKPWKRLKFVARRRMVSSRKTSQRPRVQRKRESWAGARPARSQKKAPMPAVKKKTGAQRCVIQRVKKRAAVVRARSSGWNCWAPEWKNSRVWSRAMTIMTKPRRASTDWMRDLRGASMDEGILGYFSMAGLILCLDGETRSPAQTGGSALLLDLDQRHCRASRSLAVRELWCRLC